MANFNSSEPGASLVIDTSIAISLAASCIGADVLQALARATYMVDVAIGELDDGGQRGANVMAALKQWQQARLLTEISLGPDALEIFEDLVSGPAVDTLDDGEAATLAHASAIGAVAVIDEGKARRIAGERHPALMLASTIDLLLHPAADQALGREAIAQGVFLALKDARTRVPPEHLDTVRSLIGSDRAGLCHSLPAGVRRHA
jgi:hypothetical protein